MNGTRMAMIMAVGLLAIVSAGTMACQEESDAKIVSAYVTDIYSDSMAVLTSSVGIEFNGDDVFIVLLSARDADAVNILVSYQCTYDNGSVIVTSSPIDIIGEGAFEGSNIRSIDIPSHVTKIRDDAFKNCSSLTDVTFSDSLETIGNGAFYGTGIDSVSIGSNVTSIGDGAFSNCPDLESIDVSSSNRKYSSYNGILYSPNNDVISVPSGIRGSLDLSGLSVDSIGDMAFAGCSGITGVKLPSSLETIRTSAFSGCTSLKEIVVPEGVTKIGDTAFYNCTFESVTLPATLSTLGDRAFNSCTFYDEDGTTVLSKTAGVLRGYHYGGDTPGKLVRNWTDVVYHTVSYNINGGSGSTPSSSQVAEGNGFTLASYSGKRSGYTFEGWFYNGSVYSPGSTLVMGTSDITLVASWEAIRTTGISLDRDAVTLEESGTVTLTATVQPSDALNRNVTWSSSNQNVATVSSGGYVRAVNTGTAVITATTVDGGLTASCVVTVKAAVQYYDVDISAYNNVSYEFSASTDPVNGKYSEGTTVTISDVDVPDGYMPVVTVDGTEVSDDDGVYRILVHSNVEIEIGYEEIVLQSITLSGDYRTSYTVGETLDLDGLEVIGSYSDGSRDDIDDYATSPREGTVLDGSVTSVVVYAGGFSASYSITVKAIAPTSVQIDRTNVSVTAGYSIHLTATVYPDNATDKGVTWSSRNTRVATVDDSGVVTGVGVGTAVITATTTTGNLTATCTVTVVAAVVPPTSITLSETDVTVYTDDRVVLSATVHPENATYGGISWSSSDTDVATVTTAGVVRGVSAGTAVITATTVEGGLTVSCVVTVVDLVIPPTSVTLDFENMTLKVGDKVTLGYTISPTNATDKDVTWSSNNLNVATVDEDGNVTAVGTGTATIRVTAEEGGATDTCTITVEADIIPPTSITLNASTLTLTVGGLSTLTATVYPADATNKNVLWSSSDSSVATVNGNGRVTAIGEGTAVITASTYDRTFQASCTVTVESAAIEPTGVTLDRTSCTLEERHTIHLTATVYPEDAYGYTIAWSSSDTDVATVNSFGSVTAVGPGTATIYATVNGHTAECTITVGAEDHHSSDPPYIIIAAVLAILIVIAAAVLYRRSSAAERTRIQKEVDSMSIRPPRRD